MKTWDEGKLLLLLRVIIEVNLKKLKLGPRNPSKINNKCPVTMSTASKYVRE